MEQLGRLTTAHSMSLQKHKIKDFAQFNWFLNPYEHRKVMQEGLKLLSLKSAAVLHKMNKFGILPDYVGSYIDMNQVEAIALLAEDN